MKNARHFQSAKEPVINQLGLAPQILFFFLLVLWLFALVLSIKPAQANPLRDSVLVEIRNSSFDAGNHYFDIYLRQVGDDKIFLGSSDLVISLGRNSGALKEIEIDYIPGSSQLYANSGVPVYSYGQGISSSIISKNDAHQLVINIPAPFFDEENFDDEVAVIDERAGLHRIGRFVIINVSNQFNLVGSSLYVQGNGLRSALYAYDRENNLNLKEVGLLFAVEQQASANPIWSFDMQRLGGGIRLSWQLSAEVQSMEIQKSFDGKYWDKVNVPFAQQDASFSAEDLNPLGARVADGLNLISYRLLVKAANGKNYYSAVKQLNYQKGISMVVFPNPAADYLKIRFNDGELVDFQVQIFDSRGQQVDQLIGSHMQELQLDLINLPAGHYIVRVLAGAELGVSRIMVQK